MWQEGKRYNVFLRPVFSDKGNKTRRYVVVKDKITGSTIQIVGRTEGSDEITVKLSARGKLVLTISELLTTEEILFTKQLVINDLVLGELNPTGNKAWGNFWNKFNDEVFEQKRLKKLR